MLLSLPYAFPKRVNQQPLTEVEQLLTACRRLADRMLAPPIHLTPTGSNPFSSCGSTPVGVVD